jgi:hypothetical protein
MAQELMAYCLKTKKKEELLEGVVTLTSKGGYICKGVTADGHKLCAIMSKVKAEEVISLGLAKKGF